MKKTLVNIIVNVYNATKDKAYKIGIHPRELPEITCGATLGDELKNSELVSAYIEEKSERECEDLEIINFELICIKKEKEADQL